MYAVVKTGGKQLKVAVGETVSVELLDASPGAVVTLPALAVNDGDKMFTGDEAAKATVTAEVLGHGKADKVMIFKLKKRKGYKRTRGHRQNLTLLKVTDIALAGAKKAAKAVETAVVVEKPAAKKPAALKAEVAAPKKAAPKKADPKKAAAPKAETVEKKPAAAKKPAAPKAAAEKKPAAAKKPAAKKTTKPAEPAE
ncbi:MAG TPA: 50S ribosomal protein L21 [Coriobacteriia bacterium]|jgi:large subunit ribosomal protein L21